MMYLEIPKPSFSKIFLPLHTHSPSILHFLHKEYYLFLIPLIHKMKIMTVLMMNKEVAVIMSNKQMTVEMKKKMRQMQN